jgi:hypothetical protein
MRIASPSFAAAKGSSRTSIFTGAASGCANSFANGTRQDYLRRKAALTLEHNSPRGTGLLRTNWLGSRAKSQTHQTMANGGGRAPHHPANSPFAGHALFRPEYHAACQRLGARLRHSFNCVQGCSCRLCPTTAAMVVSGMPACSAFVQNHRRKG